MELLHNRNPAPDHEIRHRRAAREIAVGIAVKGVVFRLAERIRQRRLAEQRAVGEAIKPHRPQPLGKRRRFERRATAEGVAADVRDGTGNRERRERGTFLEGAIADVPKRRVDQRHLLEFRATVERAGVPRAPVLDFRNALERGHLDGRQLVECGIAERHRAVTAHHDVRERRNRTQALVADLHGGGFVREAEGDLAELRAVVDDRVRDVIRDRRRNLKVNEIRTTIKGIASDISHGIRNRDAVALRAAQRIVGDPGHRGAVDLLGDG